MHYHSFDFNIVLVIYCAFCISLVSGLAFKQITVTSFNPAFVLSYF